MQYVNLGRTGLRVSRVCLGMMSFGPHEERPWALGEDDAEPIVRRAVEGGITFFDTADVYNGGESEVLTGRILGAAARRARSTCSRRRCTAARWPGENGRGLGRKHVLASIDGSLQRLGLDYVDLYQIHRWDDRHADRGDDGGAERRRARGKARYIGASSMYAWQFAKAQAVAERNGWARFVSMQNHYNLIYREEEREMIPQCIDQGVAVLPWSPLARGHPRREPRRQRRAADGAGEDRPVRGLALRARARPAGRRARQRGRRGARRAERAGRARVGARQAGRDRADRRRDEALRTSRTHSRRRSCELSEDEIAALEEPYVPHAIAGHG